MSHVDPPAALDAVGFLVGRFRGHGRFRRGQTVFEKDVVGRWEVGGHFLSLSMTASYRVADAVADVHHALAVIGCDHASGDLEARVFTDGGGVFEHRLIVDRGRIAFRDRVPHEVRAAEARTTLVVTPDGYEESLEITRGGERFEPYSFVRLLRLAE
ncbi:MAG: hypothetical protein ACREQQ_18505 [Candidatus Binatia bacterium]